MPRWRCEERGDLRRYMLSDRGRTDALVVLMSLNGKTQCLGLRTDDRHFEFVEKAIDKIRLTPGIFPDDRELIMRTSERFTCPRSDHQTYHSFFVPLHQRPRAKEELELFEAKLAEFSQRPRNQNPHPVS